MKKSKFTKSDLDIIAAKYRDVGKSGGKESHAEEGMGQDLAVLDWGVMISQVCRKRYGKDTSSLLNQMQKVLGKLCNYGKRKAAAAKKVSSGGGAAAATTEGDEATGSAAKSDGADGSDGHGNSGGDAKSTEGGDGGGSGGGSGAP
jgi:hypothetical protein